MGLAKVPSSDQAKVLKAIEDKDNGRPVDESMTKKEREEVEAYKAR